MRGWRVRSEGVECNGEVKVWMVRTSEGESERGRGWRVRGVGVEGDIPPACTMCCTCSKNKRGRAVRHFLLYTTVHTYSCA